MNKTNIKLMIFVCGIFICMLDTTVMNVALPQISESFSLPLNNLSWALNIYTILFASLTIPLTRVAEKFGMNRILLLGFIIFGLGSLISGDANELIILVAGRAIQSLGAALVFPLSMTLGINLVSTDKRTGVIALLGVTQGLAAALGPVIGGIITQFLNWRWIFFINIPIILFALIIGYIMFDFTEHQFQNQAFDVLGSSLSILFLLSLTTFLTQGRSWGWTSTTSTLFIFASVIFFILFVLQELHTKNPMIPLKLFKNRNFNGAAVVIILSNLFLVAVTVILPTYYTNVKNYDSLNASFMLIPITLLIFIMSPIAGFSLNKLGPRVLLTIGFTLMIIGYVGYSQNGLESPVYSCLYGAFVGAGYGLITGPITVIAASDFEGEMLSASQSVSGVLRQVGTVLAVSIFVTGLYSNLDNAQHNSEHYVQKKVMKMYLPPKVKSTLVKKSNEGIESNKNTKLPTEHTGNREIDAYINKTLRDIKKTANSNVVDAFKNLYRSSVPFIFGIIILTIFYWRKKNNN
ncbi:MFS transporter [Leuconostoc suionicum]|uniref:MFS transporter n=1 Tax=Leuconostoc suionicum TaxID=1511761 RepID=UPI0024AE26DB|nr:MFS transporter [Leuconostoc suionicum]MDI6498624.1 MFS transporter [Leuconostoc suionicum]MDI6500666.1 MFS transporter [Leuconostoc suionicum]MDI6502790.1 MFS transporter [Leuconostoc suionicum]MDI6523596.1 MFS transporter [Leuconostoc suionicum]MDI6613296.1 MFS transporter [Leuconostoc suionicum]